ncbi:synaptotagmin-4-like [Dendronephthya gigantea]|uniref:synaptotagmin-4-like n=1 Tax=Dendronephthya gigantea TaxID=151771 RepID=UPI00106AEAF0|nr:synaptotagmin-4-like [Dendronephthya gigantea]XP_028397139.1 synaptotagmin-4-like [Dendronephthya gigantea]XP_028397140.1 synaptotagmin-4-like [Dendronephthya gigantea]XP_028397141.1 synaptotagmin-4-like [Dendronephthya gigantea]XP_028397142.1 synaptotagmin-4-like [Dendronephthya gigantea]XP_028397144.1 synaptotagmin-4-like [Dendronephthya gigantea]
MRSEYEESQLGDSQVITSLISFTLMLSTVVFLGAVCRFLKKCCARFSKIREADDDVTVLIKARRTSELRKSHSLPRISTQDYAIVHQEEIPFGTEETPVQPNIGGIKNEFFLRPRAPTDPEAFRKVSRQISAPASSVPYGLAKGQTSPLSQRLPTRSWSSHPTIETKDLEPELYKKEALFQKFQTSSRNKCGTLDTEIYYDPKDLKLEVTISSIHQLLLQKHADETNTFVSVKKIPDSKRQTRRTSVHKNAVDPVYDDTFTFYIEPRDDISSHVLIYGLNHMDKFSTSYLRGEACLPLSQINLNSRRRVSIPFVEIKRPFLSTMYPVYRAGVAGCILVSLKYEPWKESIIVHPLRVTQVPKKRHVGYGRNVYVKVDLRRKGGERITKAKTSLVEMEPMSRHENDSYQATFGEKLTLEYKPFLPETTEIHISLNHYLFLKSSFIIGQLQMSCTQPGYESMHFQNMIDSPGEEIPVWYELRGFTNPTATEDVR